MYIRPKKNSLGAYPQPQNIQTLGLVELPEEFLDTYIEYSGFVELEIDGGKVVSIDPNTEAFDAWKAEEVELASVEVSDPQSDTDAMLIDHEYRLTLLELGIVE